MTSANYARSMVEYLAKYKREVLGIAANGLWRGKHEREHILPREQKDANILPAIRDEFWGYANKCGLKKKLHADFHHLTSSQAFAFNLLFPVVKNRDAGNVLLSLVGLSGQAVSWEFEAVPDREEETNFDLMGTTTGGQHLYVEIKLTEREFGTCKMNAEREKKREDKYRPRLLGKVGSDFLTDEKFTANYQLLRNLSHLRDGDRLLFIVPRANTRTFRQAEAFREAVESLWREAVHVIAAEDLTCQLAVVSDSLAVAMGEIQQKYHL